MLKRLSVLLTVALAILVARHVDAGVINVTCSNSLADAQSLNALISSSKTGDQISIHGTCLVNSTVVLRGDRTYVGDSRTGTIIKQADGANLTAMLATDLWISDSPYTGSPIHISHLTLDGNKARNIGTSVLVLRSWMSVIDDIYIANAPADAIQITNLSRSGVALTNNQVNGRISNCMITDSGAAGVHVVDSGNSVTDWDLLDCWIAFSGTTAIAMDNAAGWKVRGNHVYGVQQSGILANRCAATDIEANYVEDFGHTGGAGNTWYGIACTNVVAFGGSVVANNRVFQLPPHGGDATTGQLVYLGLSGVIAGPSTVGGVVNVLGNIIVGAGGSNTTGLAFGTGAGEGLVVFAAGNNIQAVGVKTTTSGRVTLLTDSTRRVITLPPR